MNSTATSVHPTAGWSGVERRRSTAGEVVRATSGATDVKHIGEAVMRYGLAVVFLWVGLLKFTAYEAGNIEPMLANSPIWAWMLPLLGLQGTSNLIGVIEIAIGALIATRAFWPRASAIGSIGAAIALVITLSLLLTTPGVWEPGYGFGFLSALPGQFLAKDLVLLGVAIWTAAEAWQAARLHDARRA